MKSKQEILDILNHSNGTTAYHQFSPSADFPVVTDGVIALAQVTGCFWLLDIIGGSQKNPKLDKAFQVWDLIVDMTNNSATIRGCNDTKLIVEQKIPYTNFPLEKLRLYLIDGVILLPSEY